MREHTGMFFSMPVIHVRTFILLQALLDRGTCAVAAFHDQSVCDLLGIDGRSLFPVYMASVGKK